MVVEHRSLQKGEQDDKDKKTSATLERSGEDMQGGSEAVAGGRVAAFFAGKDVFVTGGSGFLGRVLLEKLLREAPDIGTIFLLVRPKKGLNAQQRLEQFTNVGLFDVVRRAQPAAMGKLHAVEGDTGLPDLGLSAGDRALLEDRVAVVFHSAASVRFDDPLQKAVRVNVRSVQLMCDLATRMRRLEAFVHVSTAYCNLDQLEIEEKLYPAPGDWRAYIELVEKVDSKLLNFLTFKLLDKHVNTYIYTKAMGEQVVKDYSDRLPIAILRPSMVTQTEMEPFPGWMDNFYGPTSLTLAVFLGALHTAIVIRDAFIDVIPADYVVGGTVLAAVKLGTNRKSNTLPVYNATTDDNHMFRTDNLEKIDYDLSVENRFPRAYRPFYIKVQSLFWYRLFILLVDLPLGLVLDGITWLFNHPPSLVKVLRRGIVGTLKTKFSQRTIKFHNNEFLSLNDCVGPEEKLRFRLSTQGLLRHSYLISLLREWKNYFFREFRINPARIERQLLIIHFAVSGCLLFLLWKSSIIANVIRILLKVLSFFMGFPIIQFIFN